LGKWGEKITVILSYLVFIGMIGPLVLSGRKGGKMHNLNRESELELARFGEYLLKSRIVAEKHARYYVAWVRRFLSQVPVSNAPAFVGKLPPPLKLRRTSRRGTQCPRFRFREAGGEYILKKRLVPENKAQYYVGWARNFLAAVPLKEDVALEDRIGTFLNNWTTTLWQRALNSPGVKYMSLWWQSGRRACHVSYPFSA
jgi:hypothetical protein